MLRTDKERYDLNQAGGVLAVNRIGDRLHEQVGCSKFQYSFAVDGGAISTITLTTQKGLQKLPAGAIVKQVIIDVLTEPTSSGLATVALGANSTTDLLAATAIASLTGRVAGVPVGTAATAVKVTAETGLKVTIAAFALTAGKFNVFVEWYMSE
jgi:hypothetical protein